MTGGFCEGFRFLLRLRVAGSGGSGGLPSPVLPPTLEELAEEPLMGALRGRPALIVHAAAAISGRAAGVSVRTAFEHAARAADADEARRAR